MKKLFRGIDDRKDRDSIKQLCAYNRAAETFPRPLEERVRQRGMKCAFTLAELMITLGVIGVVAAVTMPSLIANINDRVYRSRHENIAQKVTQAMERMRALDKLNATYTTTDAFVDELQNYLKISKRCTANEIADCWPTSTVINSAGDEFEVSEAKIGKDIALSTETNNVGLILADGASLILNYNPNLEELDIGSRITTEPNYKYTTTVTRSIDFLTDVNGSKGPNKEGKDIRPLRIASFTERTPCEKAGGTWFAPNGLVPLCKLNSNYTWSEAIDACSELSMTLPSIGDSAGEGVDNDSTNPTLSHIYNNRNSYGNFSYYFWSATEYEYNTNNAWIINFGTGEANKNNNKASHYQVICF